MSQVKPRLTLNQFDDGGNMDYILEKTCDNKGWVAGFNDGSMVITWDDMQFMKTIHIMFSNLPNDDEETNVQLGKMEELVEWLSEYHFEKMHREL